MRKKPISHEDCISMIPKIFEELQSLRQSLQQGALEKKLEESSEIFLTVAEAAQLTRYSEQTIRMKIMRDQIKSIKVDGRRLFRKSDLLQWINH